MKEPGLEGDSSKPGRHNRLSREKSPYLLQHSQNPVDWYPWSDEAFDRAMTEDRPVFLSIGYSTCHWCHVMAHESFENPEIADLLNRHFICIKVDREERPDIDGIYMAACQLMTGQGGWPLSVFLTPDKKPFYAGTYFPSHSRSGMIGLFDLAKKIASLWRDNRNLLIDSAEHALASLASHETDLSGFSDESLLLRRGFDALSAAFDPINGGFGRAPKFPSPPVILFLLHYHKRTGEPVARAMAEKTLTAMSRGGICDQIGGGFHRYSVDSRWEIPHFEKMLYDQALLLQAYTEAWLLSGNSLYRTTAESIADYILNDLTDPDGAFITAEDADSPGGEGAYYLWTPAEITAVLGEEDAAKLFALFTLVPFADPHAAERVAGTGVLARPAGGSSDPVPEFLRSRLLAARVQRPHPPRDTKILADMNALGIGALAAAWRALNDPRFLSAAQRAMHHILSRMRMRDGGLYHRYCDGEAAIPGFADDYAFVVRALLELYQADFRQEWLSTATELQQYLDEHFSDPDDGAYFLIADNAEQMPIRRKEFYDGVIPSANSVSLGNLVLFSLLTDEAGYSGMAARLSRTCGRSAQRSPSAYAWYLLSLDLIVHGAAVVTVSGPAGIDNPLVAGLWQRYLPAVLVVPDRNHSFGAGHELSARVCTSRHCSPPVTTLESILSMLDGE